MRPSSWFETAQERLLTMRVHWELIEDQLIGTAPWHSSSTKNSRCCATARAVSSATRRRWRICRSLMPSPFLGTAVLAASALSRGGSAAQKSEYLARIADGSLLAALAIDEGAKHRPLQTRMAAVRSGNGFKLSGAKAFVVDGHTADLLIVAARTTGTAGERDGLTLFLVDPKTKGIETERTAMVDSHNAARIVFDNVEVNADGVLGEVDHGGALLEGVLNIGRGAVASEMVGLSEEVFGRTVAYLKDRKQFSKAIGEFQALQHRAAQLYIEIEITRAAVLKALQTLDGNFYNAA